MSAFSEVSCVYYCLFEERTCLICVAVCCLCSNTDTPVEKSFQLEIYKWQQVMGHFSVVLLLVGCLASQQHPSVSQGQICSDDCMCCLDEIEFANFLSHPLYADTGPASLSTDPITPGTRQVSVWSIKFKVIVWLNLKKAPLLRQESNPGLQLWRWTPRH